MKQWKCGASVYLLLLALVLLVACSAEPVADEAGEVTEGDTIEEAAEDVDESVADVDEETANEGDYVWAMVTDQHGLGDEGFNDLAHAGLSLAAEDFGGEVRVVESTEQAQYVPNFSTLAQTGNVDLIAGIGFLLIDTLNEVAPQFPEQNFALIDAEVEQPNVASLLFREQEAAYLAGVMVGMMTESNTVGFIGGLEIPPVIRFQAGYEAGVATTNPDAEILVSYVGGFDDPAQGKEAALTLYDQGADIILEVGGGSGLGAWEAAAERGEGVYMLGSDTCKYQLAPNNALPDATKGVDTALYLTAERIVNGTFEGGVQSFGLAEGGVGLCEDNLDELPEEVLANIEAARELIVSGELVIPDTIEALETFEAPEFD